MRDLLRILIPLGLALLAGCASQETALMVDSGPQLGSYTIEEARTEARWLLDKKGIVGKEQDHLLQKFNDFMASEKHQQLWKDRGANALIAYHTSEGGFLYKGARGEGFASFKGGERGAKISMSGYSVGAVIGGGSSHGLAIGFGLEYSTRLQGEYRMSVLEATATDKGGSFGVAKSKSHHGQELHYFADGFGLSADAGIGSFDLRFER